MGILICRSRVGDAWMVLVTWYISNAGGSWNLSGECSFFLFTACKQAYLVVLTVNVVVVFLILWCFEFFFFFFFSCLCSVGKSSTNLWLAGPHTKVVANTYWQCSFFFFIKCLLSVMNVFISGPALTSAENNAQCVRLRWRQDPLVFLFSFFLFVLRIWSSESKMRHKTAINHDLWSWLFVGELILFFPTQRKWSMAFSIFFLSYTWQSVRFLFHVIHYGCLFFARVFFLSSHWMTAHQGSWTLTPCVCLWTRAGHWDLPVQKGGYCIFSSLLFLGVAMLLPLKKTKNKIFT